ncbi:hypothetical protein CEXT_173421 [Caerostris extrusa]|uniref:Uncharacterized protein n=1 Tax=Caerostris extrusa TaxID=172846 RepID=A0AAV4Y3V0_CAEEX|nr:hypothetical protein CEXT_173421 [Caerostris extrusa]
MGVSNPYVGSVPILMTLLEAQDRKEDHQEGRIQVLEARFVSQLQVDILCLHNLVLRVKTNGRQRLQNSIFLMNMMEKSSG